MTSEWVFVLVVATWFLLGLAGVFLATYVVGEQSEAEMIALLVFGLISALIYCRRAARVRTGTYNRRVTVRVDYDDMNMTTGSHTVVTTLGGFAAIRAAKPELSKTPPYFAPAPYYPGGIDPNM